MSAKSQLRKLGVLSAPMVLKESAMIKARRALWMIKLDVIRGVLAGEEIAPDEITSRTAAAFDVLRESSLQDDNLGGLCEMLCSIAQSLSESEACYLLRHLSESHSALFSELFEG